MPLLLFRNLYYSVVIGVLVAVVLLVASVRVQAWSVDAMPEPDRPTDAIIDVSQRAAGDGVIALLGLGRGERVVAIDDVAATTDQVVDAWRRTAPGHYLDLTVAAGPAVRRVLVLIHP